MEAPAAITAAVASTELGGGWRNRHDRARGTVAELRAGFRRGDQIGIIARNARGTIACIIDDLFVRTHTGAAIVGASMSVTGKAGRYAFDPALDHAALAQRGARHLPFHDPVFLDVTHRGLGRVVFLDRLVVGRSDLLFRHVECSTGKHCGTRGSRGQFSEGDFHRHRPGSLVAERFINRCHRRLRWSG